MKKQKTQLVKVGDRNIWYVEALLIKDRFRVNGIYEYKTKLDAKKGLRESMDKSYPGKRYKICRLFKLPSEMEIEEVI